MLDFNGQDDVGSSAGSNAERDELRVVADCAYAALSDQVKAAGLRQGAYDYMVKPLDHATLLEKIRAMG